MARLGHPRRGLSAAGKKELWELWRAEESISNIARALQKAPGSIHGMIEATGGFSPSQRRRRRCTLTPTERGKISRELAAWTRAPSTSPPVSTSKWRFLPESRFAPS